MYKYYTMKFKKHMFHKFHIVLESSKRELPKMINLSEKEYKNYNDYMYRDYTKFKENIEKEFDIYESEFRIKLLMATGRYEIYTGDYYGTFSIPLPFFSEYAYIIEEFPNVPFNHRLSIPFEYSEYEPSDEPEVEWEL